MRTRSLSAVQHFYCYPYRSWRPSRLPVVPPGSIQSALYDTIEMRPAKVRPSNEGRRMRPILESSLSCTGSGKSAKSPSRSSKAAGPSFCGFGCITFNPEISPSPPGESPGASSNRLLRPWRAICPRGRPWKLTATLCFEPAAPRGSNQKQEARI